MTRGSLGRVWGARWWTRRRAVETRGMIESALLLVALVACRHDDLPGYQGVVELEERTLAFEVPGRVIAVTAKRGDPLAANAIVATLDDSQQRTAIAIREAEARSANERALLAGAGGRSEDIRALEAQLRAARATEQLAIKRHTEDQALVAKAAIPQAAADDSAARRKVATGEREALEQRLRETRTGARREEVAGARAQADAARNAVQLEADRLRRYELRTLEPGEVLDVHVESGEVVAAGTPVITVGDLSHPYVDVFVPQAEIANVAVGTRAMVRTDATPQGVPGAVEHVARRTEFTPRFVFSRDERSSLVIRVRIRIDDPRSALKTGVPAFVTIGG
jgi:HlyD family secretion protein